ncbi:hypothetical protein LINPERPRIM_LOCUS3238 [Linum perenne]
MHGRRCSISPIRLLINRERSCSQDRGGEALQRAETARSRLSQLVRDSQCLSQPHCFQLD